MNNTGLQHSVIHSPEPYGLGLDEKLLPQYLKDLNYSTHAIGKVSYHIQLLLFCSDSFAPIVCLLHLGISHKDSVHTGTLRIVPRKTNPKL